jgi:hypothetical protein
MRNFAKLTTLGLSDNLDLFHVVGPIHEENAQLAEFWRTSNIGQFFASPPPKLATLSLSSCRLNGLPPMSQCTQLTDIDADDNRKFCWNSRLFKGSLQAFLGAPPPKLSRLSLDYCGIKSECVRTAVVNGCCEVVCFCRLLLWVCARTIERDTNMRYFCESLSVAVTADEIDQQRITDALPKCELSMEVEHSDEDSDGEDDGGMWDDNEDSDEESDGGMWDGNEDPDEL